MSPYPAQVSVDGIVGKARELIEAEGVENLSLAKLASALGIKAPSLYKHLASKAELIRAVNTLTNRELVAFMREAVNATTDPHDRLIAMARAYRQFAHAHPVTYMLAFSSTAPEMRPDARELEQLAIPLQEIWAAVTGPGDSLAALRGAWALIHGFVTLELNGLFQRGGKLEEHFFAAVSGYIAGWTAVKENRT